jgi:Fe-S-cluster containining protein
MRLQVIDPTVSFSCGSCTACCDQPWQTLIEPEKAAQLEKHDFSRYHQLQGKRFFHDSNDPTGRLALAKGEGTRCLFLDSDGLCIIHKELGPAAKPAMCRQFPFLPARTWTEDRVSANYGCPSIQARKGTPLAQQATDVAALVPQTQRPVRPEATTPLDTRTVLNPTECDALFERMADYFSPESDNDIWSRFGQALGLIEGVRRFKEAAGGDDGRQDIDLADRLRDRQELPAIPELPAVEMYEQPGQAPMPVRFLFAATLYPDTTPADAAGSLGFLQRITLVPRLMSLARLSGAYASRLLGRNLCLHEVMRAELADQLPAASTELLARYYHSRLWQRYLAGSRLNIVAGLHQHIQDLNAILFFARAEALHQGVDRIEESILRQALTRVEFHLASQKRLYDYALKGWLRAQLADTSLAFSSLRLMCLRRQAVTSAEA